MPSKIGNSNKSFDEQLAMFIGMCPSVKCAIITCCDANIRVVDIIKASKIVIRAKYTKLDPLSHIKIYDNIFIIGPNRTHRRYDVRFQEFNKLGLSFCRILLLRNGTTSVPM